jgi:phosphohistidine phosphatase SixA
VTAVYAPEFHRTQKTAEPVARALKLEVHRTPRKADEAIQLLRSKHANDVVLIVGHSNTVPELLTALGHDQEVKIPVTEYDNLFLVVPGEKKPTVVRLKF